MVIEPANWNGRASEEKGSVSGEIERKEEREAHRFSSRKVSINQIFENSNNFYIILLFSETNIGILIMNKFGIRVILSNWSQHCCCCCCCFLFIYLFIYFNFDAQTMHLILDFEWRVCVFLFKYIILIILFMMKFFFFFSFVFRMKFVFSCNLCRYNELEQPVCRVCDIILKSESHWDSHQVSHNIDM